MTAPLQPEQVLVEQIRAEWQDIEAYRPGGGLEAALSAITPEARAKSTDREIHLLSIIETLNDTVKGYHNELGIVLSEHANQQAELTRLRSVFAEAEALVERWTAWSQDPAQPRHWRDVRAICVCELQDALTKAKQETQSE